MKTCKECAITKPYSDYFKCNKGTNFRSSCKICYTKHTNAHRKANPLSKEYNKLAHKRRKLAKPFENALQMKKYRAKYPERVRAFNAMSKATKKQRAPIWLTKEQKLDIVKVYETCPKGFHVDHIIPLRGENVSGLHVSWNLQHLSAEDNLKKGNKVI